MVDRSEDQRTLARWRLVLGQFADRHLGDTLSGDQQYQKMDRALGFLYGREYEGRGVRERSSKSKEGGKGPSTFSIPSWLSQVRELFPRDTVEVIEKHALDRYNMTELVTDPKVLEKLEPNYDLLKTVLSFRHMMKGEVLETARRIVRQVVEQLRQRLSKEIRQVLWGRLNRQRRSRLKIASNLDWKRTIRQNLKNYDQERKRILIEQLHFLARVDHHMPWHIILAVDCSGSMMDSVIYSAVMAGIFRSLPTLRVSLIAFDTAIIDLSDQVHDPTELLMSVQLGGGTDIALALNYCEQLVQTPHKSIVICVTDFCEGGSPKGMLSAIKRMREAGVRVLGLAALDERCQPVYDRGIAEQCAAVGADIAALTPQRLSEWLGRVLS